MVTNSAPQRCALHKYFQYCKDKKNVSYYKTKIKVAVND